MLAAMRRASSLTIGALIWVKAAVDVHRIAFVPAQGQGNTASERSNLGRQRIGGPFPCARAVI